MKLRRMVVGWMLAILLLSGCESAPPVVPTAPPTQTSPTLVATTIAVGQPSPTLPATPTLAATPRFRTPTPPPNTGTVITQDGNLQVIAQPTFFWTLKLPRDWLITYDRGFELFANNPQQTSFVRLLSQVWPSAKERLPTARDYVTYWKHYTYGDIFPVYARGTQVSETEISRDKFGGPYLQYEFDDSRNAVRYVQVYASGGGPNSVVLTVWAKTASFDAVKTTLDDILHSLELLQKP